MKVTKLGYEMKMVWNMIELNLMNKTPDHKNLGIDSSITFIWASVYWDFILICGFLHTGMYNQKEMKKVHLVQGLIKWKMVWNMTWLTPQGNPWT